MTKMGFLSGVITGAIVGTAVTMFVDPVNDRQKRKMYRNTNQMFKTVGSVIDAMISMKR